MPFITGSSPIPRVLRKLTVACLFKKTPRHFRNRPTEYSVHNSQPLDPFISHLNKVHTLFILILSWISNRSWPPHFLRRPLRQDDCNCPSEPTAQERIPCHSPRSFLQERKMYKFNAQAVWHSTKREDNGTQCGRMSRSNSAIHLDGLRKTSWPSCPIFGTATVTKLSH